MNWIKCSEKMPEDGQSVLIWDGENVIPANKSDYSETGFISWSYCGEDVKNATHWMPFPDPPQDIP
jgi:hypothetical protein